MKRSKRSPGINKPESFGAPGNGVSNGYNPASAVAATSISDSSSTNSLSKETKRSSIGSLVDSYGFKEEGFVKKTVSITIGGVFHHLISYYTIADLMNNKFTTPSKDPRFQHITPRPDLVTKQNFRTPIDEVDSIDRMEELSFHASYPYARNGKGKRKRLSSWAQSNKRSKTDRTDSEDTATEADDSLSTTLTIVSRKAPKTSKVVPYIHASKYHQKTYKQRPIFAPRYTVPYFQQEERPIYTSANSPALSRLSFVSMKPEVRIVAFYEFTLDNNDAIVQYLFEPAPLSVIPTSQLSPGVVSSNAEWEKNLRATVNGILGGVPLGEPRVLIIEAPFVGNQYAGEYLDFVDVAWQKCFLAARVVDKRLRKENADAGTILRSTVNELGTGRPEQTPTTLDITKILRLPAAADITLYNPVYIDLRNTPQVETMEVNLQPSPGPPLAVPLPQVNPDPSIAAADGGSRHQKSKTLSNWATSLVSGWVWGLISQLPPSNRPSQGNAVLVSIMSNGREPEIARIAAMKSLASDDEKSSAVKQALMTATRHFRKIVLKMGRIGWRKGMKENPEDEIEDGAENGVKGETWEGLGEVTEEEIEFLIENGFRDGIKDGDIEDGVEDGVEEHIWKESRKS